MKKITIKGIVHNFSLPYQGEKSTSQEIIIFCPGYINEFGEKLGIDDYIPVKAYNEKIELWKDINKGDKVEVVAALNGRSYQNPTRGTMYILNLNLRSINKI